MRAANPTRPFLSLRRSTLLALALTFALSGGATQVQAQIGRDAIVIQDFDLDESVFHQWVFGGGNKIVSTQDHLDSLLMLALEDIDRVCSLSDVQKKKLVLAGHGDRKRFMDRVAEARRVFDRLRTDPNGQGEILQATQPLSIEYAMGLYGPQSFFAKTVGKTLTSEQADSYRQWIQNKNNFRYMSKVTLILASIDARVGFTSDQRKRYASLILAETTPPTRSGSPYEDTLVLLKIAKLPEAKVRTIFDDSQWTKLDRILSKARDREPLLRAEGQLD